MWQSYVMSEVSRLPGIGLLLEAKRETLRVVRFLPGRLHFSGQKDPAPFPSAVVVWARLL